MALKKRVKNKNEKGRILQKFHRQVSCTTKQKERENVIWILNTLVPKTSRQLLFSFIQQGTNIQERLLNKPYVNEVTLRGQKPPLKCW